MHPSQKNAQWLKASTATIALSSLLMFGMQSLSAMPQAEASSPMLTLKGQPLTQRPAVSTRLPDAVKTAVLQAHARDFNLPIKTLRVVSFSQETWSDSCFGLGRPEESCGLVLVNGWRIEVGNRSERWFYRCPLNIYLSNLNL
ncbi:MAG: hypothetical protein RBJ76_26315 [Stenomitos frigidus ULC029]